MDFLAFAIALPNVNLQYPKVVIPYTCTNFEKGKHYIVNCCYNGIAEIENTTKIQVKTDGIFYENVFYPFKETYFQITLCIPKQYKLRGN